MTDYIYPFRQNAKGVNFADVYTQKGDTLERYIFDTHVWPYVEGLGKLSFVIDVGAGEGRYSQYFGKHATRVMAIEPDEYRCNKAKENLASIDASVECVHGTVKEAHVDNASADAVATVHVLQHIHPDDATAILDFAARTVRSGGLFILAFTKKTMLDEDWNLAWTDNNQPHYVEVPEDVFKMVSTSHVPTVLPVHKLHTDDVLLELKQRRFTIEATHEYAPRFLGEKKKLKGKFFMWLYRKMSSRSFHRLVTTIGYPLLEDIVVVARKQ